MEAIKLVYCQKCGTKNRENAKVCKECEAKLYPMDKTIETQARTCFGPREERRRPEDECFGLPHGGVIVGVIIGAIIIIVGVSTLLSNVFGWNVEVWNTFWPLLIIVIGILILAGAIYGVTRRPQK